LERAAVAQHHLAAAGRTGHQERGLTTSAIGQFGSGRCCHLFSQLSILFYLSLCLFLFLKIIFFLSNKQIGGGRGKKEEEN